MVDHELKMMDPNAKTASEKTADQPPHGDQFVGDPDMHGIDKPRGGGFSIMQDLQKDLHKEQKKESEAGPKIATRRGTDFFAGREEVAADSSLTAMEFPNQDAMDKYLKDHPDADRSRHKVVKTKKEAPAKKETFHTDKTGKRIRVDAIVSYPDASGKQQSGNVVDVLDSGKVVVENDEGDYVEVSHDEVRVKRMSIGKSRRAMYWGAPDRVYRLTKDEQANGSAVCPRCKKEMALEPFTKSEKLYLCQKCGFKVPTSKTTNTRITIDVDKGTGEVDVDVTTAKEPKGRRGSL
jgi:predicted RNA-binding Zn-ribbon protein involved in translation (DUF1610 family)